MTYNVNDKFYKEYEPEVADFCNQNNYKLAEIEKEIKDGEEVRVFQIQQKVKTLDELKAEKLSELKINRFNYKKTIIIKEGFTLNDLEVGTNNYENLVRLKFGWVQADLDLFDSELSKMIGISDKEGNYPVGSYNYIKNLINNADITTINSISTTINPIKE